RHDADNRKGPAVDRDGAADDTWVAAKTSLPEPMTERDDAVTVGLIFVGGEGAPDLGLRAEHVEEAIGDVGGIVAFRLAAARQRQPRADVRAHLFEALVPRLPVV